MSRLTRLLVGTGVLGGGLPSNYVDALSVVITPTTTGNELVADGNMEGADLTNWTALGTPTTLEKSTTQAVSPTQSIHIVTSAIAQGAKQLQAVTANKWYIYSGSIYRVSGNVTFRLTGSGFNSAIGTVAANTWETKTITGRALTTTPELQFRSTNAAEGYADDYTGYQLDFASMIRVHHLSIFNVTAQCVVSAMPATTTASTQAGLIINLDNPNNPMNYVVAYIDRLNGKAYLDKCVNGTISAVIAGTAIAYGAAKILKVVKSGVTYQLFYDGAQVGTDQSIANMNGTYHGRFSTSGGNTLDALSITATPF